MIHNVERKKSHVVHYTSEGYGSIRDLWFDNSRDPEVQAPYDHDGRSKDRDASRELSRDLNRGNDCMAPEFRDWVEVAP